MTTINSLNGVIRSLASSLLVVGVLAGLLAIINPPNNTLAAEIEPGTLTDQIVFWEQNVNLPDGGSDGMAWPAMHEYVLTVEEIMFLEMNLYLPDGNSIAQPAEADRSLSWEETQFLEQNVWEYEGVASPASASEMVPPAFIPGEPS